MIRMVNLSCRRCGMSLDEDVNNLDQYCPNCGGKLFITVSNAMDIWNDKKELKRKDVKYSTQIHAVKDKKSKEEKRMSSLEILGYVAIAVLIIVYAVLIGYFAAGFTNL